MKMVERKMTLVMDRVERLRKFSEKIPSFKGYQKSADWKDLAERNLQIAIEACFDIGKIIISEKGNSLVVFTKKKRGSSGSSNH